MHICGSSSDQLVPAVSSRPDQCYIFTFSAISVIFWSLLVWSGLLVTAGTSLLLLDKLNKNPLKILSSQQQTVIFFFQFSVFCSLCLVINFFSNQSYNKIVTGVIVTFIDNVSFVEICKQGWKPDISAMHQTTTINASQKKS